MRQEVADLGGRFDPRAPRHAHVHQHDVGHQVLRLLDGLLAVGRLPDELEVVLVAEDHLEPPAEQRMVVDDHHPESFSVPALRHPGLLPVSAYSVG